MQLLKGRQRSSDKKYRSVFLAAGGLSILKPPCHRKSAASGLDLDGGGESEASRNGEAEPADATAAFLRG